MTTQLSRAHLVRHLVEEDIYYPAHDQRTESEAYAKVHHQLVVVEDRPCFICGIRNSQLGDPSINVHGVKEIETHHFYIEWALANAADADRVNEFFNTHFAPNEIAAFVDHDPRQLMVLCDRHHRHKEAGIHELTFPIWVAQRFVRPDYSLTTEPPKE